MSLDETAPHEGKLDHEYIEGHDVTKVAHLDGTIDYIDVHAVGGDFEDMPPGYYYSPAFLGTFFVGVSPSSCPTPRLPSFPADHQAICLASICAYLGWVLPANTLYVLPCGLPVCVLSVDRHP